MAKASHSPSNSDFESSLVQLAYAEACATLGVVTSEMSECLVTHLTKLFDAGQRDQAAMVRHAVYKTLQQCGVGLVSANAAERPPVRFKNTDQSSRNSSG